jgi:hypothetical protein
MNIRIISINIVNYYIKIREVSSYAVLGGKYDLDKVNKLYNFDKNYLIKMRYDLDFLNQSVLEQFFNFAEDADPFLVSPAEKSGDKYHVPIDEDMHSSIKNCQFQILQDMIYYHINAAKAVTKYNKLTQNLIKSKEYQLCLLAKQISSKT